MEPSGNCRDPSREPFSGKASKRKQRHYVKPTTGYSTPGHLSVRVGAYMAKNAPAHLCRGFAVWHVATEANIPRCQALRICLGTAYRQLCEDAVIWAQDRRRPNCQLGNRACAALKTYNLPGSAQRYGRQSLETVNDQSGRLVSMKGIAEWAVLRTFSLFLRSAWLQGANGGVEVRICGRDLEP